MRDKHGVFPGSEGHLCNLRPEPLPSNGSSETTREFLQTKTIPSDVVRPELEKWKPAIVAEYNSLIHETKAVRPLSESEFTELKTNPAIKCERRAIFTIEAQTGKLKARVVACGCF